MKCLLSKVNNVLFNCRQLISPVFIKPDLPPAEHKIQSLLLKERRKLLDSGLDCPSIKICKSSLYVNGQLFGSVTGSIFQCSFLPVIAPEPASQNQ